MNMKQSNVEIPPSLAAAIDYYSDDGSDLVVAAVGVVRAYIEFASHNDTTSHNLQMAMARLMVALEFDETARAAVQGE